MWSRLLLLLFLCGCENQPSTANKTTNATNVSTDAPVHLDRAQPKLRTMKLWLGPKEIIAELAISRTEIATGMMFRDKMEENEGMLFVFAQPVQVSFYMKNTYVPLSCAYIDGEGAILEIHDLKPLDETPVYARSEQVQYVLEVKQGWFERNGIAVGTVVRTEHGSLPETFFRRRGDNP
jgi:uncharacterized membrane protein (UPF0127 family)